MVEISSGSFAPPQSAIVPPTETVSQPGQDESDADERAVRKTGESDSGGGGGTSAEVQGRENADEDAPAGDGGGVTVGQSGDSGDHQVDISV
ncbi:MAG: hypothetical protein HOB82_09740 [Alphaproteobacteria bacterium]|nr:hypothetical protein [Alphaproteobacteria bacterium]MBT4711789.1 hypothetical protein [Alphaproteobacteria bacterium]